MGPDDIPLFSMLKSRMGYLSERQRVVAQNVANSNTPGYAPRDLKPFNFQAAVDAPEAGSVYRGGAATPPGPVRMLSTVGGHLAPTTVKSIWKSPQGMDSETTLDGNAVSLEDQMLKMTEARTNYDAAIGFYQKSMNLLRMAARKPNG
jgi:flagellar basal-body rod protein FlgB